MERDHLLIILEGYGAGPRTCGNLETLWECKHMVPRQEGFYVPAFTSTWGTTQGGLMYPTLFNMVVENFKRTWLDMTLKDQRVAHDGLGETVGRCLGVLYANNGMVVSRDPDWLQHVMHVLVGLFRRYGLAANVSKSRTMTCQPDVLRAGMSEESVALKCTGVGY